MTNQKNQQTKQGLDVADFLLLAGGHLRKAREKLDEQPSSGAGHKARIEAVIRSLRYALELLKEEPCNKP